MAATASYYMHYSRLDFENFVKDYFMKLVTDLPSISKEIIEQTVDELRISFLIPRINNDGSVDKRSSFGRKSMDDSGCFLPGAAKEGDLAADDFIDEAWKNYHENQRKLLNLLNVAPAVQNSPSERAVAEAIDSCSVDSLKDYIAAEPPTSPVSVVYNSAKEIQKIELCYQILIGRLWNWARCMSKLNDLLTNEGCQKWRSHTRVLGCFAVYYASLQLYRKKACGDYLSMLYNPSDK